MVVSLSWSGFISPKPFETADGIGGFFDVLLQPTKILSSSFLVEGVEFTGGFAFALCVDIDAEQRRLGDIDMSVGNQFREVAVEQVNSKP